MVLQFEWHEPKNRLNIRKHGVSFTLAQQVFSDPYALMLLQDSVDGEDRWLAIGRANMDMVLVVAHAVRWPGSMERIRIISARRALTCERRRYENQAC